MSTKKFLKESSIFRFLKRNYFKWRTWLIPQQWYAVASYWLRFRKRLDLKNPKTFDEKLWWLKFNYHNPLQTQCADKWLVREYVKACGLEQILIETYGCFDRVEDIDLSKIPADEFFLKCNHLSGGNMIIRKSSVDMGKVRR